MITDKWTEEYRMWGRMPAMYHERCKKFFEEYPNMGLYIQNMAACKIQRAWREYLRR